MPPVKDKYIEYFNIPSFDDLDKKEDQLEKNLNKARDKIVDIHDQQQLDLLIEKTHTAIGNFYAFAHGWIEEESSKSQPKDSKDGQEKKKFIYELINDFEKGFKNYVRTDFHLEHNIKIARDFQKREEEELEIIPKTEWTKDTQTFLEKYLKKIPVIKEDITRLKEATDLIKKLEPQLSKVEKDLHAIFGPKKGKTLYTAYMAGLRQMNEGKADAAIARINSEKGKFSLIPRGANKKETIALCKKLKDEYLDNMTLLQLAEDRIFLKQSEVKVAFDVAEKELKQAQELIHKYHHPYLKSRVKELSKLRDRLENVGNVKDILKLYRYAIKGMTVSLKSYEDIRMFDASVTTPFDYLVNERMAELTYINDQIKIVMDGLRRAVQNRLTKIA